MAEGVALSGVPPERERYALIDALRGAAAMGVVIAHVSSNAFRSVISPPLPLWFTELCAFGNYGVYVFFMLSGFVIAHNLAAIELTAKNAARFFLRRSIRLDPPYWIVISLVLLSRPLAAMVGVRDAGMPSWREVVTNVLYLQEFFGEAHILGVFWTLCLEVQFYVAFAAIGCVARVLSRRWQSDAPGLALYVGLWGLGVLTAGGLVPSLPGLFLTRWQLFFAGVVTYWVVRRRPGASPLLLAVLVGLGVTVGPEDPRQAVVVALTSLGLVLAARQGWLTRWSFGRAAQFLGQISYSLYLTHVISGVRVVRVIVNRLTHSVSPAIGLSLMFVGVLLSVAFAAGFYVVVERRFHQLSRKVTLT